MGEKMLMNTLASEIGLIQQHRDTVLNLSI